MAEETNIPDYPRGITFEQVWAGFMEFRKRQEETYRQMKERDEEFTRRMQETERQMKRTDKQIGDLTNRFGEIAEHLVAPGITKRFNELGYHFGSIHRDEEILGDDSKVKTEIDIVLENDKNIIAVEVKAKPRLKDVEHHVHRLEILREYRSKKRYDERKIMGAIAGAIFGKQEKAAVIEAGMYVIEQSGDTMKIDIPEGFIPREW